MYARLPYLVYIQCGTWVFCVYRHITSGIDKGHAVFCIHRHDTSGIYKGHATRIECVECPLDVAI